MLPVSLPQARRQIQLDEDDESQDGALTDAIADAAAWVENYTGHILEPREVVETFSGFGRLRLKAWPVQDAVPPVVTYGDALSVPGAVTFASRPAPVFPPLGTRWPVVAAGTLVSVTVQAGYATPADVPGNLRRAMLVLIGGYHADREGGETFQAAEASARSLCRWFRARAL